MNFFYHSFFNLIVKINCIKYFNCSFFIKNLLNFGNDQSFMIIQLFLLNKLIYSTQFNIYILNYIVFQYIYISDPNFHVIAPYSISTTTVIEDYHIV